MYVIFHVCLYCLLLLLLFFFLFLDLCLQLLMSTMFTIWLYLLYYHHFVRFYMSFPGISGPFPVISNMRFIDLNSFRPFCIIHSVPYSFLGHFQAFVTHLTFCMISGMKFIVLKRFQAILHHLTQCHLMSLPFWGIFGLLFGISDHSYYKIYCSKQFLGCFCIMSSPFLDISL